MYKNKKILLIIPARGGSKGLPGKNIANLGGLPVVAHSILAGRDSKLADRVLVSTDSRKIAAISRRHGADVPFLRPAELATDNSPTINTVFHILDRLEAGGETFDAVGLLEPTSPLRKRGDIDNAIKILVKNWNRTDAVVSIGEIALESPFIAKKIERGYLKPMIKLPGKITRRQDLPTAYFPYGVIYLCKASVLMREKTFYPKRVMPYLIERWQNYEIDDAYNLITVRAIMKYHKITDKTS